MKRRDLLRTLGAVRRGDRGGAFAGHHGGP